ncbi:Holliday junction ATP-dependent DNA helicase RuvA [Jannaschia pagri]|uniref:Holliday junction branch migration complex subunit RuvA n=1 Tax=Jannaschia pagri TaxID=2829797 RepID=A0ABQ4NIR4_9RHOB|nr:MULTISPECIES: Holliday junction branch migration protein RuvA [unclassified Jannaschia]GIT89891.1 Holliday junction ATP-dependent DNA helicase RuvA [Jannaschia sp. AI_61]GIT94002.1 Holliday junction ATP-dependent DNA helicase RuvA [Jannaschia sp. AI_62]
MIGRLTGRLDWKGSDQVLLDVRGVGYVVFCSDRTLAALPPVKSPVALWTELLVREDLMQLFGFLTVQEREWHRLLTSVQGIGAKGSLAILGALGPDGVSRAIALGDAASIKVAKGVGPKTAQRVVMELKGKAPAMMLMEAEDPPMDALAVSEDAPVAEAPPVSPPPKASNAQAEALSALANLGYAPADAARAVAEAASEADDTPGLIRGALKRLAPSDR